MQSLLETLVQYIVMIVAVLVVGCGKKKASVMTGLPAQTQSKEPSKMPPATAAAKKGSKDAKKGTNTTEASDKTKKVPANAEKDDGGYENCKDMTPEELRKALV